MLQPQAACPPCSVWPPALWLCARPLRCPPPDRPSDRRTSCPARADKSSKAGKGAQLLVAGVPPEDQLFLPEADERRTFLESLATNVPEGDELLRAPSSTETHGGVLRGLRLSMGGLHVSSKGDDMLPIPLQKPPAPHEAGDSSTHRVAVDAGRHEQLISFVLREWSQKSGLASRGRSCSFERAVRRPDPDAPPSLMHALADTC